MPKVSIVLPNYNYARYLDERIQSLLNQTYTDFELIILDDASTDNSIEVIEKYTADPRVKTKFYTENSGLPYKRWNDGADLAQGDYLLIAGADDSCQPTLLEKLVDKLETYPSAGLAFSQSMEIDSDGNYVRSLIEWTNDLDQERWKQNFVRKGSEEFQYLLFKNTIPNASSVLMRRKLFIQAGKFDIQLRLAADYLLWIQILMISDVAFIAEPLNHFRKHASTVTTATLRNGIHLEETVNVKQYLLKQAGSSLSRQSIKSAWLAMKEEWFCLIINSPRQVSLSRNLQIYRTLNEINSGVGISMFIRLIGYFTGLTRIKHKISLMFWRINNSFVKS